MFCCQLNDAVTKQSLCGEELAEIKQRVTDLATRLEEELNSTPESEDYFKNLRDNLTDKALDEKILFPTDSVAKAVNILRLDVNKLLECGSAPQQNSIDEVEQKNNTTISCQEGALKCILLPFQRTFMVHSDI